MFSAEISRRGGRWASSPVERVNEAASWGWVRRKPGDKRGWSPVSCPAAHGEPAIAREHSCAPERHTHGEQQSMLTGIRKKNRRFLPLPSPHHRWTHSWIVVLSLTLISFAFAVFSPSAAISQADSAKEACILALCKLHSSHLILELDFSVLVVNS